MNRSYCERKCQSLGLKNKTAIANAAGVTPAAVTYWSKENNFPKWAMAKIKGATYKEPKRVASKTQCGTNEAPCCAKFNWASFFVGLIVAGVVELVRFYVK